MNPFEISELFTNFNKTYPDPKHFVHVTKNANSREKLEIVRLWLSEGIPYAFKHYPILYETIRGWMASRIDVHPKQITLIGSARIGYSLSPRELGKPFNCSSDLDFSVVSRKLFIKCVNAFQLWTNDFSEGIVLPMKPNEKFFWKINLEVVPKNINRGFIDPYKIPLRDRYQIAQKIEQTVYMLKEKLKKTTNKPITTELSIRVYKDWQAFIRQLGINLNHALNRV